MLRHNQRQMQELQRIFGGRVPGNRGKRVENRVGSGAPNLDSAKKGAVAHFNGYEQNLSAQKNTGSCNKTGDTRRGIDLFLLYNSSLPFAVGTIIL